MLSEKEQDALTIPHTDADRSPARPCFDITLFYDRPRADMGDGLVRIFRTFFAAAGQPASWWYRGSDMKKFAAVKGSADDLIRSLVNSPDFSSPGSVGLTLHAGPAADAPQTPSISFYSTDTSGQSRDDAETTAFVRLCFPPSTQAEGRERFDLTLQCAGALPLQCGHAGYSWYWNPGDTRMARAMGQRRGLLIKHPAMLYHEPFAFNALSGPYLYQIGWMTLIGPALEAQLGGRDALQLAAEDQVGIADIPGSGGLALVAGQEPIAGSSDPAKKAELRPYHSVGRALAPLRLPNDDLEFLDLAGFDDELDRRDWYLRFFEGSEG